MNTKAYIFTFDQKILGSKLRLNLDTDYLNGRGEATVVALCADMNESLFSFPDMNPFTMDLGDLHSSLVNFLRILFFDCVFAMSF